MSNGDLAAIVLALNQRLKVLHEDLREIHGLLDGIVGEEERDGPGRPQPHRVRSRTTRKK